MGNHLTFPEFLVQLGPSVVLVPLRGQSSSCQRYGLNKSRVQWIFELVTSFNISYCVYKCDMVYRRELQHRKAGLQEEEQDKMEICVEQHK